MVVASDGQENRRRCWSSSVRRRQSNTRVDSSPRARSGARRGARRVTVRRRAEGAHKDKWKGQSMSKTTQGMASIQSGPSNADCGCAECKTFQDICASSNSAINVNLDAFENPRAPLPKLHEREDRRRGRVKRSATMITDDDGRNIWVLCSQSSILRRLNSFQP